MAIQLNRLLVQCQQQRGEKHSAGRGSVKNERMYLLVKYMIEGG